MSIDLSKLQSWLNQSAVQKDNNALYQTIKGLIDSLTKVSETSAVAAENNITIVEYDTNAGATAFSLDDYVKLTDGYVIFKDIGGNASSNNITLTGSVEGVTDPVINTDYGFYHVYQSNEDGLFHTW